MKDDTKPDASDTVAGPLQRPVGRPVPERDVVGYVTRWGGNCRDCADENGVCPNSGLPCGGARKAIEHVLKALRYGVRHGYIDDPLNTCANKDRPDGCNKGNRCPWSAESPANNWRATCGRCGLQAQGSGQ